MAKKAGMSKRSTGKSSKIGKSSKVGMTGKPGKRKLPGAAEARNEGPRAQLRRQELATAKRAKRAHGGQDAVAESRLRMRTKVIQRQLARLSLDKEEERRKLLLELGLAFLARNMTRVACENLQSALKCAPQDEDFGVRIPLLCTLMEEARAEEASELVMGPLFSAVTPLAAGQASAKANEVKEDASEDEEELDPEALERETLTSLAATIGCYTRAVLKYIKVMVLEEHRTDKKNAATEEAQLVSYLRQAKTRNPWVAEFLIFGPAFDRRFPQDGDLPPANESDASEAPLREALEYCCRYRQLVVWTDTDEDVRKFMRHVLLEGDGDFEGEASLEEPPLHPLPAQIPGESLLLTTWRKAREEAMDLWADEMSEEAEEGEEESGEESSMNSSDAMAEAEERDNLG